MRSHSRGLSANIIEDNLQEAWDRLSACVGQRGNLGLASFQ